MNADEDTMLDEYDFRGGVRGKYVDRLADGSNVVLISPELSVEFPSEAAVNDALRELLHLRAQRAERDRR